MSNGPDLSRVLEFAKGSAILMIVLFHARQAWFGWQGVHLFIILSGFLLAYSCHERGHHRHWGRWARRRLRRILPAYWVTAAGGFVLVVCLYSIGLKESSVTLVSAGRNVLLDIGLLRNISYRTMMAYPNAALWYIPLILGCYVVFPILYRGIFGTNRAASCVWWLSVAISVELVYRAAAIYLADGIPVGYGKGFLPTLTRPPGPSNSLASGFPFQLWAPFGWFPSRVGEFALGVAAARFFVSRQDETGAWKNWNPRFRATTLAFLLWLVGNWMVYAGRWGWVAADLVIAPTLAVWMLGLGTFCARYVPRVFRAGESLGPWAYYLYLVHLPVMYVFVVTYRLWAASMPFIVASAVATVIAMLLVVRWLRRFDESSAADILVDRPFGRLTGAET